MIQQGNQGLVIDDIQDAFFSFIERQRAEALHQFCLTENLYKDKTQEIIHQYIYDGVTPVNEQIVNAYQGRMNIADRKIVIPHLKHQILSFIDQYYDYQESVI